MWATAHCMKMRRVHIFKSFSELYKIMVLNDENPILPSVILNSGANEWEGIPSTFHTVILGSSLNSSVESVGLKVTCRGWRESRSRSCNLHQRGFATWGFLKIVPKFHSAIHKPQTQNDPRDHLHSTQQSPFRWWTGVLGMQQTYVKYHNVAA